MYPKFRLWCAALRHAVLVIFLMVPVSVLAQTSVPPDHLTILWTERRPFQYTDDDGQIRGILPDIALKIFSQAGIKYDWVELPANRVLLELQNNHKSQCAVGWYKTAERETIAQFSQPVYQDQPLRGVFRAKYPVEQGITAKAILKNPRIRLLIKQGFAYGGFIDNLIAKVDPKRIQRVSGDARNLLQMLRASHADVIFLAQEEIDYYSRIMPGFAKEFKVLNFKEAPPMENRYIMCNKQISPSLMKRINAAIEATLKVK